MTGSNNNNNMPSRCTTLLDVVLFCFALVGLSFSLLTIYEQYQLDSPRDDAAQTGLHLLSCPHLFNEISRGPDEDNEGTNEYRGLRLSREGGEILINTLNQSLAHAKVFHAGPANEQRKGPFKLGYSPALSYAITQKLELDGDEVVDVNVPRKSDNGHLCRVLEEIVEQEKSTESPLDSSVTISIVKLERGGYESSLLRGARAIAESPFIHDLLMRLSRADREIRTTVSSVITPGAFEMPFETSNEIATE